MFYELIQVALGQREKLGRSPSDGEWAELFVLSQKQGVVGVVLPALEKLSASIATILRSITCSEINERKTSKTKLIYKLR